MKWKKLGHIFNPTTWQDGVKREWMQSHSQSPHALILEDVIRVYFCCRPIPDNKGYSKSFTTFLELDKNNPTKVLRVCEDPILPLGSLGCFDQHAVYPISLLMDNNKLKLYYAGWSRGNDVPFDTSIGIAISKDLGLTFQRLGNGPILSASLHEPFVISGPKIRKFNNKYYLYYLAGTKWINETGQPEIIYKNRMATSHDGLQWKPFNKNIIPDVLGELECQAGPDVFFKDGKYHMYFVYREGLNFRTEKGRGYKIGYATSHDLYNWDREDSKAGIIYLDKGRDSQVSS